MQLAEMIAFLRQQRYAVVSSVAPSGAPEAAVVGIAVGVDGELVFDTLGDTHKARNLRRDPRVAVTVWSGERTLQLAGVADEPDGAEGERVRALYFVTWPGGVERLSWPGLTHFRVRPTWARYSDFGVTPGPLVATHEWP